jgi:hypothetical protein
MKLKYRRVSAAALTLIFCLSVAPVLAAKANHDRDSDRIRIEPPAPIVRIVKRIKNILQRISGQEDLPQPPVP